ncbi:MAG: Rieske 2Fe-2S domain-containing protein [Spirochaetia bacterium]|nr:Rieske 2Fe-2S domain-containing protein [Spirochaetia bacterium]
MTEFTDSANWIEVAKVADLADIKTGNVAAINMELDNGANKSIILIRTGVHEWSALDNVCTHDGGCLDDGEIDLNKNSIECNRHGANFNIKTGEVISMPAIHPVQSYPVKIESDILYIQIP